MKNKRFYFWGGPFSNYEKARKYAKELKRKHKGDWNIKEEPRGWNVFLTIPRAG